MPENSGDATDRVSVIQRAAELTYEYDYKVVNSITVCCNTHLYLALICVLFCRAVSCRVGFFACSSPIDNSLRS